MKIKNYLITYERFEKGCVIFRYYDDKGLVFFKYHFLFYSIPEARKLFKAMLIEQFKKP